MGALRRAVIGSLVGVAVMGVFVGLAFGLIALSDAYGEKVAFAVAIFSGAALLGAFAAFAGSTNPK